MFDQIGEGLRILQEGPKQIDLEELERLAKEATPGPWFVTCNCTGKTFYTIKNSSVYIGEALGVYNGEANATYIVAACNALPDLIAENRALQERVRKLEAELESYKKPIEFPKLRESVANVDNSLSDFLDESIKRAAARP